MWWHILRWRRADGLEKDWMCLVIASGTLASPAELSIVAAAVPGYLWRHRHERQPVLIVADEAHNICPLEPADNLEAAATSHAIKIAGEGRKFGLYLLVSTQRPGKIHANVLSQCDNLVLTTMNSPADLEHISHNFSQASATFLEWSGKIPTPSEASRGDSRKRAVRKCPHSGRLRARNRRNTDRMANPDRRNMTCHD